MKPRATGIKLLVYIKTFSIVFLNKNPKIEVVAKAMNRFLTKFQSFCFKINIKSFQKKQIKAITVPKCNIKFSNTTFSLI